MFLIILIWRIKVGVLYHPRHYNEINQQGERKYNELWILYYKTATVKITCYPSGFTSQHTPIVRCGSIQSIDYCI